MRYKRPYCEECYRLWTEKAALSQAYDDAREALKLTPKNHPAYGERNQQLKKVTGQLREARKREYAHEETHQDEFH